MRLAKAIAHRLPRQRWHILTGVKAQSIVSNDSLDTNFESLSFLPMFNSSCTQSVQDASDVANYDRG